MKYLQEIFEIIGDFIPVTIVFIIIMLLVALGMYLHSVFEIYNQIK